MTDSKNAILGASLLLSNTEMEIIDGKEYIPVAGVKRALARMLDQETEETTLLSFKDSLQSLDMTEVLRVTVDGEFIWSPDADEKIEKASPAMRYVLRSLREFHV